LADIAIDFDDLRSAGSARHRIAADVPMMTNSLPADSATYGFHCVVAALRAVMDVTDSELSALRRGIANTGDALTSTSELFAAFDDTARTEILQLWRDLPS